MKTVSEETRRKMSESAKKRCNAEWRRQVSERMATPIDAVRLRELYEIGHSQDEVASLMGVSQKVIWKAMRRLGIKTRKRIKRNQRGDNNASWAGDGATYQALHRRVEIARGKPGVCEECGDTEGRMEWANLTGNYADVNDYKRMCVSCHRKLDAKRRSITGKRTSQHVPRRKKAR